MRGGGEVTRFRLATLGRAGARALLGGDWKGRTQRISQPRVPDELQEAGLWPWKPRALRSGCQGRRRQKQKGWERPIRRVEWD